jgi:hypothetical protein
MKMGISVNDKRNILEAYLKKAITKDDMKFLFEVGLTISPIRWIFKNEADEERDLRKRDLIEKVTGQTVPKIKVTWKKSDEN